MNKGYVPTVVGALVHTIAIRSATVISRISAQQPVWDGSSSFGCHSDTNGEKISETRVHDACGGENRLCDSFYIPSRARLGKSAFQLR
jgi:hypothetical protein